MHLICVAYFVFTCIYTCILVKKIDYTNANKVHITRELWGSSHDHFDVSKGVNFSSLGMLWLCIVVCSLYCYRQ